MNKIKILGIGLVAMLAVFSIQGCSVTLEPLSCSVFDSSQSSPFTSLDTSVFSTDFHSWDSDCDQYYAAYEGGGGTWSYLLTNMSVDWDLYLYSGSNFSSGLIDYSVTSGTFSEYADTSSSPNIGSGYTYVKVVNYNGIYGGYDIDMY